MSGVGVVTSQCFYFSVVSVSLIVFGRTLLFYNDNTKAQTVFKSDQTVCNK